jgi:hypothetical protein
MINLLTANVTRNSDRYNIDRIQTLIAAQIVNSYDVGWLPENILLVTNFGYNRYGIKAEQIEFNPRCLTGSKMYAVRHALKRGDVVWAHDLDAWQNVWFECPEMLDIAAATYDNHKFNGGSIFWRPEAMDLVDTVIKMIDDEEATYEENVLNRVFRANKDRVTKLNFSYNVGCSNYRERWGQSLKPIRVAHFHPYNRIAWETHALDRCKLGTKGITDRLERVLRNYYTLATELKEP